jgi:hypothetical protein
MGFLDNLESSLNNLERQDERDASNADRRAEERKRTLAVEPAATELKNGPWTKNLFDKAALVGHRRRTKIYLAWMGPNLRLEARGRTMDLVPGPDGVTARYEKNGAAVTEPVQFDVDPENLLEKWLSEDQ